MSFRPGIDYQLKRRSRWFIAWKHSFCTRVLTVIIALGEVWVMGIYDDTAMRSIFDGE